MQYNPTTASAAFEVDSMSACLALSWCYLSTSTIVIFVCSLSHRAQYRFQFITEDLSFVTNCFHER